jgi:CubicO group peptidase (beta-lactamase class C family)
VWAGIADADTGRPWKTDTPVLGFSVSKGVLAICAHALAQTGALDLDAPISRYWPEFAENGKEGVTVSWALSHRAGLAYLDGPLGVRDVLDWATMIGRIERQAPNWLPGSAYAYHAVTYGHIIGEVIRRVSGLMPAQFLREYIAGPLEADAWYGVPVTEITRVARMDVASLSLSDPEIDRVIDEAIERDDRAWRALSLNGALRLPIGTRHRELDYNRPHVLCAQIPAAALVTTGRALARIYASTIGPVDGLRTLTAATVARATMPRSEGAQVFDFGIPTADARWGEGFQLPSPLARPMLGPASFGHDGASGSLGFADPVFEVGFGYVNNRMSVGGADRANAVSAALLDCLRSR